MRLTKLDRIIRRSLCEFVDAINRDQWSGRRKREAISLYVLGHLQREVRCGGVLFDVRQIGIEMPVRQIDPRKQKAISKREGKPKQDVAKDLLIWARPQMTTWTKDGSSQYAPRAILEWKMGRASPFEDDLKWLEEYSRERPKFTGYVVSLLRTRTGTFLLNVARVKRGVRQLEWLNCDGTLAP